MALQINTIGELEKLLRKLKIEVHSPAELQSVWETVNKPPDPEAARMEAIKVVGLTVPIVVAGVGGLATLVTLALAEEMPLFDRMPMVVASLGIIWGVVAGICIPTLMTTLAMLYRLRPTPTDAPKPAGDDSPSGPDRNLELPVDDPVPARKPALPSERVTPWEAV